jgi:ribosome-interacting GTPase 1
MTKPLIIRSDEVVENLTDPKDGKFANDFAYARAFGAVWATLSDEQRQEVLAFSEKRRDELSA